MSATQLLWVRLEESAALFLLSANRPGLTQQELLILDQCRQKLVMARDCLDRAIKRPFSFWELLHEADALLLLVLPEPMLHTRAMEVQQLFEQKIKNRGLRELWLGTDERPGPLREAVHLLRRQLRPPEGFSVPQKLTAEQLARCRNTLRGALNVVRRQLDKSYWQISLNVSIQILSALLLLVIFAVALGLMYWQERLPKPPGRVSMANLRGIFQLCYFMLFGMTGAILSNMLSKERFAVSTGATARFFLYYLFVKPMIGAIAALLLVFTAHSGLMFSVVASASGATAPSSQAPIQIVTGSEDGVFFALAVLSLAIGFSADRMLSSMMDAVLGKIIRETQKEPPASVISPEALPGSQRTPPPRKETP